MLSSTQVLDMVLVSSCLLVSGWILYHESVMDDRRPPSY